MFNFFKSNNIQQKTDKIVNQARRFNTLLWADINNTDKNELKKIYKDYEAICRKFPRYRKGDGVFYIDVHKYRLILTYSWLKEISVKSKELDCFDMDGGDTVASQLLKRRFKNIKWLRMRGELRKKWPLKDKSVDLIVSTEVLEHISDFPKGFNDKFEGSGLRFVLKESNRILKPGGTFFISTPNANSALVIAKTALAIEPDNYRPHIREYTSKELIDVLRLAGFKVEKFKTYHCCSWGDKKDYTPVFEFLLNAHFPVEDRGDTIFIVAKKVSSV